MGGIISDVLDVGAAVAAPFTGGTSLAFLPGLLGGLGTASGIANNVAGQNSYDKAMQQNQQGALSQVGSLAGNLAQGPNLQSLIDAEGSGVKTLQSNIGGVANPGALIKELYGGNIQNAIGAGLNTRSSDLQGAINALLGAGGQYGSNARNTGSNASTIAGIGSGLGSAFNALSKMGVNAGGSGAIPTSLQPGGSGIGFGSGPTSYTPPTPSGSSPFASGGSGVGFGQGYSSYQPPANTVPDPTQGFGFGGGFQNYAPGMDTSGS